jgi:hypothetical protein
MLYGQIGLGTSNRFHKHARADTAQVTVDGRFTLAAPE